MDEGLIRERALRLRELAEHPGWAVLVEAAEERIHALQRFLIDGKAEDYADYRARAAHAAGMLEVFSLPELYERMANDIK